MKGLLIAASMLSTPAMALQIPTPSSADPRICDVTYDANNITSVVAIVGNTVAIRFSPNERLSVGDVSLSDSAHLVKAIDQKGTNMLWLKASSPMPPQPISIRTIKEDGTPRDYVLRWTATDEQTSPVRVASAGTVSISEEPKDAACYLIRYNYPSDVSAAQAAAWRARKAKERADAAEIALHKAELANRNFRYIAQGDASIAPDEIYDDGNTTTLRFPGNTRIPIILTHSADGKSEAEVSGTTTEQGGIVKVHSVLPYIKLRGGDLVLCIFNKAYSAVGDNPGTGTTSETIDRAVGSR